MDGAHHIEWLKTLTTIPTAAGREWRVVEWIRRWVAERDDLALDRDDAGNLVIGRRERGPGRPPLLFTAHLDHPAFVVESGPDGDTVRLSFRGGVGDRYFEDARIRLFTADDAVVPARVVGTRRAKPFRECVARLEGSAGGLAVGDVGVWDLPPTTIAGGLIHTPACDDLAAVAAALAALDELRDDSGAGHVQLLFTRAEEIGFVGATAACVLGTIPAGARVLALENSRSYPHDSPIGAGPIVRVGDKACTFDPGLTRAVALTAARLAEAEDGFVWQRKLMPGGTCEASVFCAYGHAATCVCLPLGNYHNQADLPAVEADPGRAAAVGLEQVSLDDFHNLVRLLVSCGRSLEAAGSLRDVSDALYRDLRFVL